MVSNELQNLDHFLYYASAHTGLTQVNPIQLDKAYAKFLRSKKNPTFRYIVDDPDLPGIKAGLQLMPKIDTPLGTILEAKRKELLLKTKIIEAIGTPEFTKLSLKLYPAPDPDLIKTAQKILKLKENKHANKIKRTEALKMVRNAFKSFEYPWKVVNKEMLTSARVSPMNRKLELRKRERFSANYIKRLIVHEIGVHGVRAENGRLQPLKIFSYGTANYLDTEEGLAAYMELQAGVMSTNIIRQYAGRVIAIDTALRKDFITTYNTLRKYFKPKTAYKLTLRAKRGLKDTSKPGAFTKDAAYLRGLLQVYNYASKGKEMNNLFTGKISLKDLKHLKEHAEIQSPRITYQEVLNYAQSLELPHDEELVKEQVLIKKLLEK